MATSGNYRGFPEDLVSQILSRLPVKSLLRFKCGCKNWYALIKNPNFIKQHLNCSNNNKEPQLLIYDYGAQDDNSPPITLINSYGAAVKSPDNYFHRFRGMSRLIGSVDGLFLLERVTDNVTISIALWNPAIRELRLLPVAHFDHKPFSRFKYFGFGLDPLTNDYKVVCFQFFHDEAAARTKDFSVYVAVHCCSTNSWRIFSPDNYSKVSIYKDCYEAISTAYLNGAYYWLLPPGLDDPKCKVLSFDFRNEVFEEIQGPHGSYFQLVILDDSVALLHQITGTDFEIWVMIQPGVWKKIITYECFTYFLSWYSSTAILVTKRCRLVSYNVRTKETRHLGFCHRGLKELVGGCSVYCYRESLVSIERPGNGALNHSLQLT